MSEDNQDVDSETDKIAENMANNNSESALSEKKTILSEDETVCVPIKVPKEEHVHHDVSAGVLNTSHSAHGSVVFDDDMVLNSPTQVANEFNVNVHQSLADLQS